MNVNVFLNERVLNLRGLRIRNHKMEANNNIPVFIKACVIVKNCVDIKKVSNRKAVSIIDKNYIIVIQEKY